MNFIQMSFIWMNFIFITAVALCLKEAFLLLHTVLLNYFICSRVKASQIFYGGTILVTPSKNLGISFSRFLLPTHNNRHRQMNFSLMYVYVLRFPKICFLTYFHVKISVRAHEAKISYVLSLQRKTSLKPCFFVLKKEIDFICL